MYNNTQDKSEGRSQVTGTHDRFPCTYLCEDVPLQVICPVELLLAHRTPVVPLLPSELLLLLTLPTLLPSELLAAVAPYAALTLLVPLLPSELLLLPFQIPVSAFLYHRHLV
jgi:hypothetical protein